MNFNEANRYLLALGHETLTMKLGLEGIRQLLHELGNPHLNFFRIQIAGTNGKGSTAAMLSAMCQAGDVHCGLYTSPHLVSITERIRINNTNISREAFARCATVVCEAAERIVTKTNYLATFFEQVTAIALVAFAEARVKVAILETGLGGRLDAVTATASSIVAITPLALDHQNYLGTTLAEIAREKAAVIRPDTIAIIAPQPDEAHREIEHHAASVGVTPRFISDVQIEDVDAMGRATIAFETPIQIYKNLRLNLCGRHQATNAHVAVVIAKAMREHDFIIGDEAIRKGLFTAQHQGRLEWLKRNDSPALLFDGAHNIAGATALRDYLREFARQPLTLLFGAMGDKDVSEIAGLLFPLANKIVLTQPDNPRAADVNYLRKIAVACCPNTHIETTGNVRDALTKAFEVTLFQDVICVTGSLYLIGEVKNICET